MLNLKFLTNLLLWFFTSSLFVIYKIGLTGYKIYFFNWHFFDSMSILLVITTYFTLFLSFFIADSKYFLLKKSQITLFFSFSLTILMLVQAYNLISFFIFYELLLVPSYFLVKYSSPNKRSEKVSIYFLMWTQFGSFLVLLGIFLLTNRTSTTHFFFTNFTFNNFFVQLLIFFGFGVKIPLWPFHFWLSKTHVEANTGFSIFLSGILVKAAVFGIYKFCFIFNTNVWFFITIILVSVLDSSLKMCIQTDLKKLVAFSTIQEMAFMTLLLLTPSLFNYQILFLFIIFHTIISAIFFLLVDIIYKRYGTRVIGNINGISNLLPNLSAFLIINTYLFIGIPLTVKFSIEISLIKIFLNFNSILTLFVLFISSYISMIFFFKVFVSINFGNTHKLLGIDLSKKEFILLLVLTLCAFFINFI